MDPMVDMYKPGLKFHAVVKFYQNLCMKNMATVCEQMNKYIMKFSIRQRVLNSE
jgi:hypothetical protein